MTDLTHLTDTDLRERLADAEFILACVSSATARQQWQSVITNLKAEAARREPR